MEPQAPNNANEAAKTAAEQAAAQWEGDFKEEDLHVPYKREAEEAKPAEPPKEDEAEVEEEPVEYAEPAPVVTVGDPGDYQPKDYSFEVTNKDGKLVKISTPDEADSFANDDDNFKTAKDLKDFLRKSQKMENALDKDLEAYESRKAQWEAQNKEAADRQAVVTGYSAEFDYLVNKKLLPAIDAKYKDADWSEGDVAKQPGVKEQLQILDYMAKENETRAKAGIRPLTSIIDAYNAWKLETGNKQDEEAEKTRKEGDARRAAGARVAGVSATNTAPYVPKGIAVGNPNLFTRGSADWEH